MSILVTADETFPKNVWFGDIELEVLYYGIDSTPYGAVPVVATDGEMYYAGEADVVDGFDVFLAVNGYADLSEAISYAESIYTL